MSEEEYLQLDQLDLNGLYNKITDVLEEYKTRKEIPPKEITEAIEIANNGNEIKVSRYLIMDRSQWRLKDKRGIVILRGRPFKRDEVEKEIEERTAKIRRVLKKILEPKNPIYKRMGED